MRRWVSGGPPTRSDQADQGLLATGAPIIDNAVGVDAEVKSPMPPLSDQRSPLMLTLTPDSNRRMRNGALHRLPQYSGSPVFTRVGFAFSKKRKSAESATVADLMFTHANIPSA